MSDVKPEEAKPMTPDEAISLLDQVCGQVSLTRENHTRVLVAVGIVRRAIENGHGAKLPKAGDAAT